MIAQLQSLTFHCESCLVDNNGVSKVVRVIDDAPMGLD